MGTDDHNAGGEPYNELATHPGWGGGEKFLVTSCY